MYYLNAFYPILKLFSFIIFYLISIEFFYKKFGKIIKLYNFLLIYIILIFFLSTITNSLIIFIFYITNIFGFYILILNFSKKNKNYYFYNYIDKHYPLVAVIFIFLFLILCIPLTSFDGRTIWFFHSKVMFFNKSIFSVDWFSSALSFSQIHYPKINAILSSTFSNYMGIWNYHLSKISIWLLLIPIVTFYYNQLNIKKFFILIVTIIFFFQSDLINGYMDSFIALYTVTLIYIASNITNKNDNFEKFLSFTLFSSILIHIKDEGFVTASLMLTILFFILLVSKKNKNNLTKKNFYLLIIIFISYYIYFYNKYYVFSNITFFGENDFRKININLMNLNIILDFLMIKSRFLIYAIILGLYIFFAKNSINKNYIIILTLFNIIFFLILIFIYLISPLEIKWHLSSSADRVLYTLKFSILSFLVISLSEKFFHE
jgi:hypothetical protein